jgi:hypothetical protein
MVKGGWYVHTYEHVLDAGKTVLISNNGTFIPDSNHEWILEDN